MIVTYFVKIQQCQWWIIQSLIKTTSGITEKSVMMTNISQVKSGTECYKKPYFMSVCL